MINRIEQKVTDTWDLSSLFPSETEWRKALNAFSVKMAKAQDFKGKLESSEKEFHEALAYIEEMYKELERLSSYAFLSFCQDGADSRNAEMAGIISNIEADFSAKLSYFEPEMMNMDKAFIEKCISDPSFSRFRIYIEKTMRGKEHILSEKEEHLLSLFSPVASGPSEAFNDLNNVDLRFEDVYGEPLTHSTFHKFMLSEDEEKRKKAYRNYYNEYEKHQHIIARLYENSIKKDIFLARARGFETALERSLFPDKMPTAVYTSLIESVHANLPTLHRFYNLKARLLGKTELHHYDVYARSLSSPAQRYSYDDAVSIIYEAAAPLGNEYRSILRNGLTDARWVDRYENTGKRSGAFSAGGYIGLPYILTNFEDDDLSSIFTLIHEGGHSMHSYYSAKNNPFMSYSYTIFEAEVASTFNENLLHHYLQNNADDKDEKIFLIAKNLDDIVATLFRQTMFAEFELIMHERAERGDAITLNAMRSEYRKLLEEYFGPIVQLEEESDLECLRIPHFYRAFYCYKYATGISASIALSEKLLNGGEKDRMQYLEFLRSGGSEYPLDSLKKAGVDMATRIPVDNAIRHFSNLLDEIEELL